MSVQIQIILFILGISVTTLLGVLAWIGNGMVTQLKNISVSMQRIEVDLGMLNTDHLNLKEEVKEVKIDIKEIKKELAI